jgi:RNA polymerase sigma-70 factor (ECF subfamily)
VTPEQAFDQYHEAVFRFLYRLTRRADSAEDLAQETFLAFLRAPERFDGARGNVRTYLFAIARNLALKEYRDCHEEALDRTEPFGAPAPPLEIGVAVGEAVGALVPLQREALILFEYEGLSLEEIAGVVAADLGTVKSRLHRAREALKRTLAPYRKGGKIHGTV